jgi:hypothetical protein
MKTTAKLFIGLGLLLAGTLSIAFGGSKAAEGIVDVIKNYESK